MMQEVTGNAELVTMNMKTSRRAIARIKTVKPLDGFNVRLTFADGIEKTVNLEPLLHGPIFEPMREDMNFFRQVYVDGLSETLTWSNGADIDPDVLRYDLTPAWMEEEGVAVR